MTEFAKTGDSGLGISLGEREADLLRSLLVDMRRLLDADVPRSDPVVARMFPNAYEDDTDQQNYENMVGSELRDAKSNALQAVHEKLGSSGRVEAVLETSEIDAWLTVVTDLRLALGTRLEVTEERMGSEIHPDDPDGPALLVLDWLGWIQQSILEELQEE